MLWPPPWLAALEQPPLLLAPGGDKLRYIGHHLKGLCLDGIMPLTQAGSEVQNKAWLRLPPAMSVRIVEPLLYILYCWHKKINVLTWCHVFVKHAPFLEAENPLVLST